MMIKKIQLRFIVSLTFIFCAIGCRTYAEKFWTEKDSNAPALVTLPNLSPIIELVDKTIVHVASTTEPKQAKEREQRGPQPRGPIDPFMNPEDFFERFFGNPFPTTPQQQRRSALGSGFIISKDGYILTNNHVVEGADKVEISLLSDGSKNSSGKEYAATIVGRDPATDVALLKIKASYDLPVVPLGNSGQLKKGDWVLAFGNPFGLDHSVSVGIVSATGREISPNENRRFDEFIQTDAAINFGNSGGPLVNLRGEVIGINTAITAQGSGIGFAIPVNLVKEIIPPLKESGSVSRGYLGVTIQDVTEEIKDALGLKEARGVLVNDVVADGPASKSDLKRGDIILKVNGIDVPDARSLQKVVAKIKPSETAKLDVLRDKKPVAVSVKVGNLSAGEEEIKKEEPGKADILGLIVGIGRNGVLQVEDVESASPAGEAGVAPGDIIRKINNQTVKSLSEYQKILKGLKPKQTVLLDLERGNVKLFIAFRLS